MSRVGFIAPLIAVFVLRLGLGTSVIDRLIGLAGLSLALLFGVGQYRWKELPKWATDVGLVAAGILIGIAIAPFIWLPNTVGIKPAVQKEPTESPIATTAPKEDIAPLGRPLSEQKNELKLIYPPPAWAQKPNHQFVQIDTLDALSKGIIPLTTV